MFKPERIIFLSCASIAATSAMTAFSYLLSRLCKENYREPEHLANLVRENTPKEKPIKSLAPGWILHYAAGVVWALIYEVPFGKSRFLQRSKSAMLGTGSGVVAAMVWKLALNRNPGSAKSVDPSFFAQLIPAHLVFGLALRVCERLAGKSRPRR